MQQQRNLKKFIKNIQANDTTTKQHNFNSNSNFNSNQLNSTTAAATAIKKIIFLSNNLVREKRNNKKL